MEDNTSRIKNSLSIILAHNIHDGALHINEALALIFAVLTESCNQPSVARSDYSKIIKSAKFLNKLTGNFQERVETLLQYFSKQDITTKSNILLSRLMMSPFVTCVEDSGYLSFADKLLSTYLSLKNVIGTKALDYYIVEFQETHQVEAPVTHTPVKETTPEESSNTRSRQTLIQWKQETDRYAELYHNLYPKIAEKKDYTWQYLLTKQDYEALQACVEAGVPTPGQIDLKKATILCLYIGEHYKRVGRGLSERILPPVAEKVAATLAKPVYQNDKNAERNNTSWLHSLYADGGLHVAEIIERIKNNQTHNKFVKALNGILNHNDQEELQKSEDDLTELFADMGIAISQSYAKHQSIYEYIHTLGKRTWHESDDIEFQEFKKLITEGIVKENSERKFRISFRLWQYEGQMGVIPSLRFSPAAEGKYRYLVPKALAKGWSINADSTNSFIATISLTKEQSPETIKEFHFVRNVNGDYIEMTHQDTATLNQIMLNEDADWKALTLKDYSLQFTTEQETTIDKTAYLHKGLPQNLQKRRYYIQFYTNDGLGKFRNWQPYKGAAAYTYSAILFDSEKYDVRTDVNDSVKQISSSVSWVEFEDSVQLVAREGKEKITIRNNKGRIYAMPAEEFIHHSICKNSLIAKGIVDGAVDDGNGNKCYIVKSDNKLEFTIKYVSTDNEIKDKEKIVVKIYNEETKNYEEYSADKCLSGYVRFKITAYDIYETEVHCFFLPENADIVAEQATPNRLRFIGFNDYIEKNRQAHFVNEPFEVNRLGEDFICSDIENAKQNFVTIHFPTKDAQIQIYRPRFGVFGSVKGEKVVATHPDRPFSLPVIYAADAQLVKITARETETIDLKNKTDFSKLFGHIVEDNDLISKNCLQNIPYLSLRIYTREIQDNDGANLQWGFLYLDECKLEMCPSDRKNAPIAWANSLRANGILFQSLKDEKKINIFCVPKQIGQKGRLSKQDKDTIFYHFEAACTHRMYFASLESILSLVINSKGKKQIDAEKLSNFLLGYWKYTQEKNTYPHVNGLLRLAREFGFKWEDKKIEKQIKDLNNQDLIDFYNDELKSQQ